MINPRLLIPALAGLSLLGCDGLPTQDTHTEPETMRFFVPGPPGCPLFWEQSYGYTDCR